MIQVVEPESRSYMSRYCWQVDCLDLDLQLLQMVLHLLAAWAKQLLQAELPLGQSHFRLVARLRPQ